MENPDGKPEPGQKPVLVEQTKEHEPHKTIEDVLKQEVKEGLKETRRPAGGLFLSALSAGLDLGFSVLLIAVVLTLDKDTLPPIAKELLVALAYTVGFVFVIIGNSELFTEHTTLAVFPLLNGSSTLPQLLRLWGIVYAGNLVGATAFAVLLAILGPGLSIAEPGVFGQMARQAVNHPWYLILGSAVVAGWLMGLVSWLVTTARETVSQILLILLVTGTIGFAHLHHAIAGTIEVLVGIFAGQGITWLDFFYFLFWATLGNIIGGGLIVALVKFGHATQTGSAPEVSLKK